MQNTETKSLSPVSCTSASPLSSNPTQPSSIMENQLLGQQRSLLSSSTSSGAPYPNQHQYPPIPSSNQLQNNTQNNNYGIAPAPGMVQPPRDASASPMDAQPFFERIEWDHASRLYIKKGDLLKPKGEALENSFDAENKIYNNGFENKYVNLTLRPKVEKGFFMREGRWTCFRRNHFQVALELDFDFDGMPVGACPDMYVMREDGVETKITSFYVSILAHGALSFSQLKVYQSSSAQSHADVSPISFDPAQKARVSFRRLQFNQSTPSNTNRHYTNRFFSISLQLTAIGEDGIHRNIAECFSAKLVVLSGTPGQYKKEAERGLKRDLRPYEPNHRPSQSMPSNFNFPAAMQQHQMGVSSSSGEFRPGHKTSYSSDLSHRFLPIPSHLMPNLSQPQQLNTSASFPKVPFTSIVTSNQHWSTAAQHSPVMFSPSIPFEDTLSSSFPENHFAGIMSSSSTQSHQYYQPSSNQNHMMYSSVPNSRFDVEGLISPPSSHSANADLIPPHLDYKPHAVVGIDSESALKEGSASGQAPQMQDFFFN